MLGTMQALSWAFGLRGVDPDSKLAAIYIAGHVDQDGVAVLEADKATEWLGFVTSAQKLHQFERLRVALQGVPSIAFDYRGNVIYVKLEIQS